MAINDLTGHVFRTILVICDSGTRTPSGGVKWLCKCQRCGRRSRRDGSQLRRKPKCMCELRELARARFTTHGLSGTRVFRIWSVMHRRCTDPAFRDFPYYGGRGIYVCSRWADMSNFVADMGFPPSGHTLERRDVNAPYSPQNCCWADRKAQANNTRRNHYLQLGRIRQTLSQWSEDPRAIAANVSYTLLRARMRLGWPLSEALITPPGRRRK
jgi:hypothetical protein